MVTFLRKKAYRVLILGLFLMAIHVKLMAQSALLVQLHEDVLHKWNGAAAVSTGIQSLDNLNSHYGVTSIRKIAPRKKGAAPEFFVVNLQIESPDDAILIKYKNLPEVKHVEWDSQLLLDGIVQKSGNKTNDPYYDNQWWLRNTGQMLEMPNSIAGNDICMEDAWNISTGDSTIVLAIIDSGTNMSHFELRDRVWFNQLEIPFNDIDDDSNGYVDDITGWNMVGDNRLTSDDNGHGTAVAGVAAANGNNNIGFAGIDWKCRIMTIKSFSAQGVGSLSNGIEGVYYAVDNGANVINMSFGGPNRSDLYFQALEYAWQNGVLPIAAMGNRDTNQVSYPAGYSNTIAVGSISANGRRTVPFCNSSGGSSYGPHIDVCAPGDFIYVLLHNNMNEYDIYACGTSFSAPMVSGLATLILSVNKNLGPEQLRNIIRQTATDRVGRASEDIKGFDDYHGYGLINAYAALRMASNATSNGPLEVYPNPVGNELKIVWHSPEIVNVHLFSLQGSLVQTFFVCCGTNTLDVSALPNGVYVLRVDGRIKQKIVVLK